MLVKEKYIVKLYTKMCILFVSIATIKSCLHNQKRNHFCLLIIICVWIGNWMTLQ
jgi:hypothetical protein